MITSEMLNNAQSHIGYGCTVHVLPSSDASLGLVVEIKAGTEVDNGLELIQLPYFYYSRVLLADRIELRIRTFSEWAKIAAEDHVEQAIANQWLSINDHAPDDNQECIIKFKNGKELEGMYWASVGMFALAGNVPADPASVTHWRAIKGQGHVVL